MRLKSTPRSSTFGRYVSVTPVVALALLIALVSTASTGPAGAQTSTPPGESEQADEPETDAELEPSTESEPASQAVQDLAPGGGDSLVVARPTWDTGWFQAEVIAQLLGRLGYRVDGPVTYDNDVFYQEVQTGEVDLWVNGWFPLHNQFLPDSAAGPRRLGTEVRGGALQGYMADLETIQAAGIDTLADLADPEVAARFDNDGNGKADLIGCNLDWACHPIVEHHLDAYGLRDTVEQISSDYGPLMQSTALRYGQGEPVLYYTYTPNWTVGVLVPGRDVGWIPVPEPSLPDDMAGQEEATIVSGIEGCLSEPCAMGFPPNDIQTVINPQTAEDHPAVASLLEDFTISLTAGGGVLRCSAGGGTEGPGQQRS